VSVPKVCHEGTERRVVWLAGSSLAVTEHPDAAGGWDRDLHGEPGSEEALDEGRGGSWNQAVSWVRVLVER